MTSRQDPTTPPGNAARVRPATLFGKVPETAAVAPGVVEDGTAEQTTDARIAHSRVRVARDQPDGAAIRGQWERAQKDLARVQVLREREAEQTKAKLTKLHEALQIAQEAGSLRSQSHKQQVRRGILVAVAGVVVLVAGGFGAMKLMQGHGRVAPVEVSAVPVAQSETATPQTAFSHGIGRLSQAFNRFPGSDPEAIIRAVNKKSGSNVCAFAWNAGQPALQFGSGGGASLSVAGTLTKCAEAVEQFR